MTRSTTLYRSTTLRVAGAVAALAVTAPLTLPASGAGKGEGILPLPCDHATTVSNGTVKWETLRKPRFEAGLDVGAVSQDIASFAVSPTDTRNIAVTNGNSVYVSKDSGCSWFLGFRLDRVPTDPRIPLSGVLTTIKSLYVAPVTNTFFAIAEELETGATVGRPHILRSETGGPNTWTLADDGLPPIGKPLLMRGHRTNGSVLYLSFAGAREESNCPPAPLPCENQQGRRLGLLYRSTDGGRTWASRTDPGDPDLNSAAAIKYFSVDDDDRSGNQLWVVANGLLRESKNGGLSYTVPDGLDQSDFEFTAVESLADVKSSYGLKLVAFSNQRRMIRYHNGRWLKTVLPFFESVESVAQRPDGDISVATAAVGGQRPTIWRIYPSDFFDYKFTAGGALAVTYGWEGITPSVDEDTPVNATIQAGPSFQGRSTYYVRQSDQLLRFLGTELRREISDSVPIDLDPLTPPKGRITPPVLDLDLPVGKSQVVDYTLTLPPSPTPLDVYLLVDNSGSMLPFINDLKFNLRNVALALHRSGVDVGIGVGQINVQPDQAQLPVDNPRTEEDESKPRPIYQRLRRIGPVNADLFRQLNRLDGNSGGGDEPQLEALYQSVTGTGLSLEGLGFLVGYSIPPGHDAGFRNQISPIKVIVHATDEEFSANIQGKGAKNDKASVIAALRSANVKQIGLSQGITDAENDLKDIARGTGALAPRGGTDCDGDGRIGPDDVRQGQPLVCGASNGLDRTLLNLLNSLSDRATLTLQKNASPAMVDVSRESFVIDAKRRTRVKFSVTYSCKGLEAGQYASDITASLRNYSVAKAVATVNCGGLRTPVRPPQFVIEPGNPPPPPQPQPLVPAPVPVNPVPQPQTQVQAQTQVNPQGGMADQEEEQFSLALAGNEMERTQEEEKLAMTGLSYDDAAAAGVVTLGMAMAGAYGAVALRRRSRTAAAKVTTGR